MLRVLPALGVPLALAFALKGRGGTNEQIGLAQSIFLAGIGAGSLACALFVRRAGERTVLWSLPLPVAPLLWAIPPAAGFGPLLVIVAVAGVLLGATMPILVSYGQQLLPEGRRTASSITMGAHLGPGRADRGGDHGHLPTDPPARPGIRDLRRGLCPLEPPVRVAPRSPWAPTTPTPTRLREKGLRP